MKTISLLITLLIVGVSNISIAVLFGKAPYLTDSCQVAGIFATVEDFIANRLIQKVELKGLNNKFDHPSARNGNTLTIIIDGKPTSYKPGSLYGYLVCGQKYHYLKEVETGNGNHYSLLEEGKISIYTLPKSNSKNIAYFYSTSLTAPIKPLTITNLQTDYKSNPDFLKELEILKDKTGQYHLGSKDQEGHFNVGCCLSYSLRNKPLIFSKKALLHI